MENKQYKVDENSIINYYEVENDKENCYYYMLKVLILDRFLMF